MSPFLQESTLLIATWSDGLFVATEKALHQELAGLSVRGLASDGQGGALAIVAGRSLRRRTVQDGWRTLASADVELSCCAAVDDVVYVGTEDARVLKLGPNASLELVTAFAGVAGRGTWYAGTAIVDGRVVGPPLGVRSLTATCDGAALLANIHVGGIPRSTDRGAMWHPTIDIHADIHEVRAHPTRPELVIAAAAVGLCISWDGGASWSIERDGLHAPHCSGVGFAGDDILISASEDPFSTLGAIYRRPLFEVGPLHRVGGGMPEWTKGKIDTGCIASQGPAVATVDMVGNVYRSTDAGRTWYPGQDRIPGASSLLMV